MPFIEAPTTFYLGRRYNPENQQLEDDVVYYDSRDLTTHSVVVGMTGSGKTGLCITMLEEAILDNIPAIIIDPKGDITNLLLTFPQLRPEDFEPWVNVDDARRSGMSVPEYSGDIARRWRDGLQSWGIVPERLEWLRRAAEYRIYTPGSDAGLPVSILASLAAPREGWAGNEEALREKINGITTALLALIGLNVEPLKDREHVLVANIFENAWKQGQSLTMEDIILQVQNPPFNTLGVLPIDQYMSEKSRFKLAMDLNNIIAAPSFQSWINGEPIDIQRLLYQPNGRPRVSIFYIAHLSEPERLFIITLLLENMLGWMRTLSGTTSLRSLLYIDEMFGYFPPYPKNPPTKEPMLRLLKQARAFGIGLILATQNPGDLDYKGLSNAGTWFIGRLQSENDKQRIMDGLRSMADATDYSLRDTEELIADIAPRVFLMRNVHDQGGPVLVHTRWAMNYLRGPLTRQQVQILMRDKRQEMLGSSGYQQAYSPVQPGYQAQAAASSAPSTQAAPQPPATLPGMPPARLPETGPGMGLTVQSAALPAVPQQGIVPAAPQQQISIPQPSSLQIAGFTAMRPAIQTSTVQYFFMPNITLPQAIAQWTQQTMVNTQGINANNTALGLKPILLSQAQVRYQDKKAQLYTARTYSFQVPDVPRAGFITWEEYQSTPVEPRSLGGEPPQQSNVMYGDLPPGLSDTNRMKALNREMVDMLYSTARLTIPTNPTLGVYANPDMDFSQFQAQVQQVAREQRDAEMDKVSQKYATQMERLDTALRRKSQELTMEKRELGDRRKEELFTTGEALLSLWQGRTNYTLSRMSRASRYRRQTKADLGESYEAISGLEQQMVDLEAEYQGVLQRINEKWAQIAVQSQDYVISPYKKDVNLELFGIGWIPYWILLVNNQVVVLPAYQA